MIDFASNRRIESKKFPGVTFVIRVMTEAVRVALNLKLAEPLAEIRGIQAELDCIEVPRKPDGTVNETELLPPAVVANVMTLTDRVGVLRRQKIDPAYGAVGFVSIEGASVNGVELTSWEQVYTSVPESLYAEIIGAIRTEAEMTDEERRNLESPTTSAAEAGGPTIGSDAVTANETDSTK